jgi:hypothetical protein
MGPRTINKLIEITPSFVTLQNMLYVTFMYITQYFDHNKRYFLLCTITDKGIGQYQKGV